MVGRRFGARFAHIQRRCGAPRHMGCNRLFFPSARTAFRAAPCSHPPTGRTLSAERKKSRRLGAILGSNGLLAVRLLRQSHLFGSGYPVGLCSNSSEQLCLSAAGSANCRLKTSRTVWLNGIDTRARSRARRRGPVTVAQWDWLHVFTAPEGVHVAGDHGGATRVSILSGIEKKDDIISKRGQRRTAHTNFL